MKKNIYAFILVLLSTFLGWYSYAYLSGIYKLSGIFISGVGYGIFFMLLRLNVKNKKLDSYKRELEKESISSDENLARVKVLESKISVLEKALENALKK